MSIGIHFTPDPKPKKCRKKRVNWAEFAIPKKQPCRNEAYLEFIRQQPCIVSGQLGAVPHHEPLEPDSHGMGLKGPDTETLPLLPRYHTVNRDSVHVMGIEAFCKHWDIEDWRGKIKRLQKLFEGKKAA